jgi:hypothetical protein
MRDYYLHLYDTSGRQITHGALRISAGILKPLQKPRGIAPRTFIVHS